MDQLTFYIFDAKTNTFKKIDESELENLKTNIDKNITEENPPETIVIKLPDEEFRGWKELAKSIVGKDGVVEYVPVGQNGENWKEIITIKYNDGLKLPTNSKNIEAYLNNIRKLIFDRYPKGNISWNTIEVSNDQILYEWVIHEPYKNIRPQHSIHKEIFTNNGQNCAVITQAGGEMSSSDREKWIKVLNESTEVVPFKSAFPIAQAISLADRSQSFLDLGAVFSNWKVLDNFDIGEGSVAICYIPPYQIGTYVAECFEVHTIPNIHGTSMAKKFDREKSTILKEFKGEVTFDVLEESSDEIIFSYSTIKDGLKLTAIVRSFIVGQGSCYLCYKKGLTERMSQEEVLLWKDKLKMIKQK
jgi:hypothetical protein